MEGFVMSTLRTAFVGGGALAAILIEAIASCLWVESCWQNFVAAEPLVFMP